jgi:hypothetical protein
MVSERHDAILNDLSKSEKLLEYGEVDDIEWL